MNTRRLARNLALDLCNRSQCSVQVGAVLSDNHGIFAWGWNHYSFLSAGERGVHAEEHAFKRANPKRVRGSTLTIAGIRRKHGKFIFSKPCREICLPLLMKHGVEYIEYTTKSGEWEKIKLDYRRVS